MKIAIIGLGKMGGQIAEKLILGGIEVIGSDRSQELIDSVVSKGAIAASSREDVIAKFGSDKVIIWLMIPAFAVEEEITAWQELLPKDSILIDGGNSDYRDTKVRGEKLKDKEINYIDVGTSGGILGYKNGFSMMVGGDKNSYELIKPILTQLAKPAGAYDYFGSTGSGHFVKMVHNAIEYGVMESLAEGYHVLKDGPYKEIDLAKVADVWQHGSIIESSLNGLAETIFKENPELNGADGVVAESGEARWTLETAKTAGIEMPATQASFDVRINSQKGQTSFATKLLAELRNKFGGHSINPNE